LPALVNKIDLEELLTTQKYGMFQSGRQNLASSKDY
jgi:hypothetical protein